MKSARSSEDRCGLQVVRKYTKCASIQSTAQRLLGSQMSHVGRKGQVSGTAAVPARRISAIFSCVHSFIYLVFQRSTKVDIELVIVQLTNGYIKIKIHRNT
jgi:hypothetical protein